MAGGWGGVRGRVACMAGGMCGRGACMAGGPCVAGGRGGMCGSEGMHGRYYEIQ